MLSPKGIGNNFPTRSPASVAEMVSCPNNDMVVIVVLKNSPNMEDSAAGMLIKDGLHSTANDNERVDSTPNSLIMFKLHYLIIGISTKIRVLSFPIRYSIMVAILVVIKSVLSISVDGKPKRKKACTKW